MKKTKRYISLLLVVQMMLMCILTPGVAALEAMEESVIMNENAEELMPMAANECHGETWTEPRNLTEQLALEAAMASPTIGVQLPIILTDPRWPSSLGWYKYQYAGDGFNLHYVYNINTGIAADFKFVLY